MKCLTYLHGLTLALSSHVLATPALPLPPRHLQPTFHEDHNLRTHRPGLGHPIDPRAPFTETPSFTYDQLYNLSSTFFNAFLSPNNAVQARKINSTLFAENVLGRVDVTRDFNGRELNTEYAFGLFANIFEDPSTFTLLGVPQSYVITHFLAAQNVVSLSAIVQFNVTKLSLVTPVEILFWATFNSRGEINQYDATFRYLNSQFDYLTDVGKALFHVNDTAVFNTLVQAQLADSICETSTRFCNGTNLQYPSKQACVTTLTQDKPLGQAHQLGDDNVLCRMVHQVGRSPCLSHRPRDTILPSSPARVELPPLTRSPV